jgi:lactoylglutathione lyase
VRLNYAIVFVADMKRSVAFYRDMVGLPLKFESPHWTEFATEGATLALHQSNQSSPANASDAESPGRCRPGLGVSDLDEFHQRMLAHEIVCVKPSTKNFGIRIAHYLDPDGLSFSVSEDRRK